MTTRATATVRPRSVLTIAGSDSGGGAGIAADLRVIHHHGLHAVAAITAVTAQNTRSVSAIQVVPARQVAAQIDAVRLDFDVAAIKTGMLATRANVLAVASCLATAVGVPLVVDPVLRAGSGRDLLDVRAITSLRRRLFPLATLVTPNLPELERLTGRALGSDAAIDAAADDLLADGAAAVLVKGGHGDGRLLVDRLYLADGGRRRWTHRRRDLRTHGTGCTLSAAVAAGLASGAPLDEAVAAAIGLVQTALARRFRPARSDVCLLVP